MSSLQHRLHVVACKVEKLAHDRASWHTVASVTDRGPRAQFIPTYMIFKSKLAGDLSLDVKNSVTHQ